MHDDIFVAFIIGSYERGSCGEAKIVAGMFLTKRGETLDYTGSPMLIGILSSIIDFTGNYSCIGINMSTWHYGT